MEALIQTQIALEEESLAIGQQRYLEYVQSLIAKRNEVDTLPVIQLMGRMTTLVAEAIRVALEDRKSAGSRSLGLSILRDIGMKPEVLAVMTLRRAFNSISTEPAYASVALSIAESIINELNYEEFAKQDPKGYEVTQRYIKTGMARAESEERMKKQMAKREIVRKQYTDNERAQIGACLLDRLLQVTPDWFDTRLLNVGNGKSKRVLMPTEKLSQWLMDANNRVAMSQPIRLPMVVKPMPWVSPIGGGYLTSTGGSLSLIKTRNSEYIHTLDSVDLTEVYSAINAIQETAFAVNTNLLDVAEQCWAKGITTSAMPSRDPDPIPAYPPEWEGRLHEVKANDYENYKVWAIRAAITHDRNNRLVSKRIAAMEKLTIARRFSQFDSIYFPHCCDFRGRVYPVPQHLTTQGDDLSKALLMFSEGKPITERGIFWLKVHIANCFGVDKVTFAERVQWVDERMELLLDSGIDPLGGERFWLGAEDEFQALAGCMELVGVSVRGADHVSHLSIPMDGSCNGLQNFAALLRDSVGAEATNVVPSETPSDIYTEVLKLVEATVRRDADAGNVYALIWDGNLSRKIVKQPVMTLPYGATLVGMRQQIDQALQKINPTLFPTKILWAGCGYLAEVVYSAIGEVVVSAVTAMDFLREVAQLAASEEYPIRWTSPIGLPILQDYRESIGSQVQIHIRGRKQKLIINRDGDRLSRRRQKAGISPNLIHSFDASHMMLTVNVATDNGIGSFQMIHDSFATHACDTDAMHQCIREAFILQYTPNLLERFRDEIAEQLPDDVAEKLPELPQTGTLDLASVRDSQYFFA